MSSNALNYLALLAALVVGYGFFVGSTDTDLAVNNVTGELQGYYLRDAIITETTSSGAPLFRIAAADVAQNLKDDSVALTGLRVDYLKPTKESPRESAAETDLQKAAHWVLNSDAGTAFDNFRRLALRGNVQAHNLGATSAIVLDSPSLDVDTVKETASSEDTVQIGIDRSTVTGRGLFADLNRERFSLASNIGLRLAQIEKTAAGSSSVQIPESFDAKSFSYADNNLTMLDVVSKSPPFVKAQRLKASGRDIANNKIEMQGAVSVELPKSGSLTADTAIVTLRNRSVSRAYAAADSPDKFVEFQHRAKESGKTVRGRAATIDYDVEQSVLHLRGNVWLSDERGEWTMEELDYNLATEAWQGTKLKATLKRRPKSTAIPATDNP